MTTTKTYFVSDKYFTFILKHNEQKNYEINFRKKKIFVYSQISLYDHVSMYEIYNNRKFNSTNKVNGGIISNFLKATLTVKYYL